MQIFLCCINNDINPIHVITLQESWGTNAVDMKLFQLPDYTMLYDESRLSKHGGLITYVHDSYAVDRLDKDEYHQNSAVFESMILKIPQKKMFIKKYIIGNVYRCPSDSIDELSLFNQEFALLLSKLQANPYKSYICGDFNINLLKIKDSKHCNVFFENVTSIGIFPQITMPTRLSDNSNTLIDNIFTNNICKPHESGILLLQYQIIYCSFAYLKELRGLQ